MEAADYISVSHWGMVPMLPMDRIHKMIESGRLLFYEGWSHPATSGINPLTNNPALAELVKIKSFSSLFYPTEPSKSPAFVSDPGWPYYQRKCRNAACACDGSCNDRA